jgi:diguanylate cyclase (GGDEF)-like protein
MDIEMPVMNGFEAANRIRTLEAHKRWAWTPIIFLTSSDTVENLVTAIEAGGDDFMSKFVPEPVLNAKMKAMARIASLRRSLLVANEKLQNLADHDGLTGLFNRRSMDVKVDQLWLDAIATGQSFSILMIDIDNFKNYNDHYGHQIGDDCLRRVSQSIELALNDAHVQGLPKGAFAARYGGEEFAVVVPETPESRVVQLSQTLVEVVCSMGIPHARNADWGKVTVSLGSAFIEEAQGKVAELFRRADSRLYLAKNAGRNRAITE